MAKTLLIGYIIADDGPDGVAVVPPRDGLETLLPGLNNPIGTVSHICSLILFLPTGMVLAPN